VWYLKPKKRLIKKVCVPQNESEAHSFKVHNLLVLLEKVDFCFYSNIFLSVTDLKKLKLGWCRGTWGVHCVSASLCAQPVMFPPCSCTLCKIMSFVTAQLLADVQM